MKIFVIHDPIIYNVFTNSAINDFRNQYNFLFPSMTTLIAGVKPHLPPLSQISLTKVVIARDETPRSLATTSTCLPT